MEKNAIAIFRLNPSGCQWYRIKQPMDMLKKHGINIKEVGLNEDISDFETIKSFQFYGAFPFSSSKVMDFIKSEGIKIVYDADDALDLIEPTNPFYYQVKKDAGSADEVLQYADEVTVSTLAMAEYIKTKTDKPITVIPNCFTPEDWTFTRPDRQDTRIGFAGSPTHIDDLVMVLPSIKNLQEKYKFTFIIMGFGQSSYEQWYKDFRFHAPQEGQEKLVELDKMLSEIKFEWVEYVNQPEYPSTLINMALDIGICPLKDTPFNRCRSACKAMEYTLSGAVALASDLEPYQNEPTSVLVKDTEWEDALELMIKHPDVRESFHKAHLLWLKANRDINTQYEPLKSIYLGKE